jgi:hypothetical protein
MRDNHSRLFVLLLLLLLLLLLSTAPQLKAIYERL